MWNKFKCAIAFSLGVIVTVGAFAMKAEGWLHHPISVVRVVEAANSAPATNLSGFPVVGGVLKPFTPPLMKRDDFITPGHADDKFEISSLFATYIWYHDSHNGAGAGSLFTKDGTLEILWNNGGKTVEPNGGPNRKGCLEIGPQQVSDFFGTNPIPFVGHSHNQITNLSIQVRGDVGALYANWTTVHSNGDQPVPGAIPPNTAVVSHNGEYVADARRTPEGWRFTHLWILEDQPQMKMGNAVCEQNVVGK
jgi:hypothetical protein